MSGPSFQRSALLSFLFHASFATAVLFAIHQSHRFIMPSPYIVSLVDVPAGEQPRNTSVRQEPEGPSAQEAVKAPQKTQKAAKEKQKEQRAFEKAAAERSLSERLSALEAKKRIEKIGKMRAAVSRRESETRDQLVSQGTPGKGMVGTAAAKGDNADEYYAKVTKKIWEHWVFPETGGKDLMAVISIQVLRDGTVQIKGVEKTSGNTLFDRSAIRAVSKASPLPPPPYEMELGVRFFP